MHAVWPGRNYNSYYLHSLNTFKHGTICAKCLCAHLYHQNLRQMVASGGGTILRAPNVTIIGNFCSHISTGTR
jgi:hypothetical protein